MKLGTKSLLFGAHCVLIHPFAVAYAWWKLYGFPFDPRLWLAFFLHDIGYWGKADLDGPEGKNHPILVARIMHWLFDTKYTHHWWWFMLCHSRSLARDTLSGKPSKLCYADKLSLYCTPDWLWIFCARLSGELGYFMDGPHSNIRAATPKGWLAAAREESTSWMLMQAILQRL